MNDAPLPPCAFTIGAVKLGMLANAQVIHAVADALEHHKPAHVVLDPVMVSTSGLTYAVDRFKGWNHSAHVTLRRGERSRLADYASEVL